MTRISLKEAYDNKDVAVQIFGLADKVEEHDEILKNLPDPDLTNCVLKTGDQTIDGEKTFTDVIHADGGLDLANMGPLTVNGNLEVNGDIIQNGSAYETHAEQVFSESDYIVTRDGAVSSLSAGQYSGIQIKKYNGVNDARLVVDNTGTARVGDINDEQPLLTRDEAGNMSNGALLKWDGVHAKAVSSPMDNTPTASSVNAVTSGGIKTAIDTVQTAVNGKVAGTGNIGSDDRPIKIVNGVAVAVSHSLPTKSEAENITGPWRFTNVIGSEKVFTLPAPATTQVRPILTIYNNDVTAENPQGTRMGNLYMAIDSTGKTSLSMELRNADGTYSYHLLCISN